MGELIVDSRAPGLRAAATERVVPPAAPSVRLLALGESVWPLWACVLLGLALRLAVALLLTHPEVRRGAFNFIADEPSFHRLAAALAQSGRYSWQAGGPPSAFRPPGVILPLAAVYALVGVKPVAALLYTIVCGVLVVLAADRLARAVSSDGRVIAVADLLAAVLPTQLFTSAGIWSEPQAICFTLLLLALILERPRVTSVLPCAAVGACGAAAYLTRPSAATLLPLAMVWAWYASERPRRVRQVGVLLAALTLPIALWGARNWLIFGEPVLGATVAGEALWGSNNPVTAGEALPAKEWKGSFDLYEEARRGQYRGSWVPMAYIPGWTSDVPAKATELEIYHRQVASVRSFVRSRPAVVIRLLGYKLERLITLEPYAPSITLDVGTHRIIHRVVTLCEYWLMVIGGTVGMFLLAARHRRAASWLAAFVLAGLAQVLVTYPNPRFLLPVTSVLMIPAAVALVALRDRARRP